MEEEYDDTQCPICDLHIEDCECIFQSMSNKIYDSKKEAQEALKSAPSGSMILATGKPGNEKFKIIEIAPGPGGTIAQKKSKGGSICRIKPKLAKKGY